jgi:hypothetical protein
MIAIMFVRDDRRTPRVEQPVWTNSVRINESQSRRMDAQRATYDSHRGSSPQQGTRFAFGRIHTKRRA